MSDNVETRFETDIHIDIYIFLSNLQKKLMCLEILVQILNKGLHNKLNPLNAELNPICYLMALLRPHHFLHVSRIRVKSFIVRLLMSYIYIYIYIWSSNS